MQLSEKDICSDALATEKFLINAYNSSITECANPQLRQDFLAIWQEEHNLHRQVFETMSARGWYQLNQASPRDVSQLQQQFRNIIPQQQPSGAQQPTMAQPQAMAQQQPSATQQQQQPIPPFQQPQFR